MKAFQFSLFLNIYGWVFGTLLAFPALAQDPEAHAWQLFDPFGVRTEASDIGFQNRIGETSPEGSIETRIQIHSLPGQTVAEVTLVFPNSGFRVTAWGEVRQDEERILVDVDYIAPGKDEVVNPVMTPVSHRYDLPQLPQGHYTFVVLRGDHELGSKAFEIDVHRPVPAGVELSLGDLRESPVSMHAKVSFSRSNYRISNQGDVKLEGNAFVIDAEAKARPRLAFTPDLPEEPAVFDMVYRLEVPEPGEYEILYRINGTLYASRSFTFPSEEPPRVPAEVTLTLNDLQESPVSLLAKIRVLNPLWRISDDGDVRLEGNTFVIDAEAAADSGMPQFTGEPEVTDKNYQLEVPEPGEYEVVYRINGTLYAGESFTFPREERPRVPAEVSLTLDDLQESPVSLDTRTLFVDPFFVLMDPGTPRLNGKTFVIDAEAGRVAFIRPPDEPAITEVNYKLQVPGPGEYQVVYRINGFPYARKSFRFPPEEEPPSKKDPADEALWRDVKTEINVRPSEETVEVEVGADFHGAPVKFDRWGEPHRHGRKIYLDLFVDRLESEPELGGAAWITFLQNTFRFDDLRPGNHFFTLRINETPVDRATFVLRGDHPFGHWLDNWLKPGNGASEDSPVAADPEDADADGASDFVEWALASNPIDPNERGRIRTDLERTENGLHFGLRFKRPLEAVHHVEYRIEVSDDLIHWRALEKDEVSQKVTLSGDGNQEVTARLKSAAADVPCRFVRLRVVEKGTNGR